MKNDFPGQKVLKATYTVQLHLQNINSICSISDKSSPRWCFNMSGSGKLPLKEPQSLLGDVFSDTKKKIHFSILSNHGQSHVLWGLQNQSTFLLEGLLILTFPCDAQCFIPYTCKRPQWMLPVYSSCFVSWCRNMKGFALNSFLIKFSKDSLFRISSMAQKPLEGEVSPCCHSDLTSPCGMRPLLTLGLDSPSLWRAVLCTEVVWQDLWPPPIRSQ